MIDDAIIRDIECRRDNDGDITGSTSEAPYAAVPIIPPRLIEYNECTLEPAPDLRLELIRAYALLVRGELMLHGLDFDGEIAHLTRIIELAGDGR